MKILLLDIERSPNIAYVWGLFKENIPLARLVDTSYMLCFAAKWYNEDEIHFDSRFKSTEKKMLQRLHKLLDEADVVVHYNGTRFDIPVINTEFIKMGMAPPSPFKQVDLLKVVRKQFNFTSNKMDHVSQQLGLGSKHETNFDLWIGCMNDDPKSWRDMERYNIEDVMILERMYNVLVPWIPNHPNHGLYQSDGLVCPSCGGAHFQKRGTSYTVAGTYQRYQCLDCRSWFRDKSLKESKESYRGAN